MTNEEYVVERNKLIPEAEKFANEKAQRRDKAWGRIFLKKMGELAEAKFGQKEPEKCPTCGRVMEVL